MKKFLLTLALLSLATIFAYQVQASSQTAYQDYRFQFDRYRQLLADFRIANTQYQQFHSLASEQDTLDKVKLYIAERDVVAKTYFLFLNEKMNENPGLGGSEAMVYRAMLTNQIGFLDQNSTLAPSIGSLDDATKTSDEFVKNYNTMQAAYRQTILGLELGYLEYFAGKFDAAAGQAQSLIAASRGDASPEKQSVLDRWLLALSNKHSLFQQKSTSIRTAISKVTGDVQEQDRKFTSIQTTIGVARQDLVEGTSYLLELQNALQYE